MCFRHFSSPKKLTNFQFRSSSKCSFFHYSVSMQRICLFSLVLSLLGTRYVQLHLKQHQLYCLHQAIESYDTEIRLFCGCVRLVFVNPGGLKLK